MHNELREDDSVAIDEPVAPHPDSWEIVVLLAVFHRRGLCTRQDLADEIEKLHRANAGSETPFTIMRKPYLATNRAQPVLVNVLAMLHKNGLVPAHGDQFIGRVRDIIAMSERTVRKILR
jgi:hypothetical protein